MAKVIKGKFKSGRGGARVGAGRPKGTGKRIVDPAVRRERIDIRLPAYVVAFLREESIRSLNPSQMVEVALNEVWGPGLSAKLKEVQKRNLKGEK